MIMLEAFSAIYDLYSYLSQIMGRPPHGIMDLAREEQETYETLGKNQVTQ